MITFEDCVKEQQKTIVAVTNIEEILKMDYFIGNKIIKKRIIEAKMVIHGITINLTKANKQENLLKKIYFFNKGYNEQIHLLEEKMGEGLKSLNYDIIYSGRDIDRIEETKFTIKNIYFSDFESQETNIK